MRDRVIIVGAGHAGLEAAFAAARVGVEVVVVTGRLDTIGQTPCNPSVGGVAKAHLVAEIEALGGIMGRAADACAIHGRVLNLSKGPAMWSTRLQVDKARYGAYVTRALLGAPGIEVVEGLVAGVEVDEVGGVSTATGVRLTDGTVIPGSRVVVTTGTFLGGLLHTGSTKTPGGRVGEAPATALSAQLRALGFSLSRLKTGTPPRLSAASIDLSRMTPQPSDEPFPRFTPPDEPDQPRVLEHVPCHLTHTCEATHEIIEAHLHESAMYSGQIKGVGPRYCPSVEDKIVRFRGRDSHQVFVEPEGLDSDLIYPNGISTSLPVEIQAAFIATIPGFEGAVIVRPGYAVEYDAVDARALTHELESKDHRGLYFAGQINGTSGYEEAGIQGLVAGANAAASLRHTSPLHIARDEGYAGVLIDDLITQGCDEPYRMFTSRAEYRILLRQDNADLRLTTKARASNLIDDAREARVARRRELMDASRRGESAPPWIQARAEAERRYEGYIERQRREIERIRGEGAQDLPLPGDLDYAALPGLSAEQAQRFARVRPSSTAQAARIPGVTPAALMCLWAHARQRLRSGPPAPPSSGS